jgi:hypothetical protein
MMINKVIGGLCLLGLLLGTVKSAHADFDLQNGAVITSPANYTKFYLPLGPAGNYGHAMFSSTHDWTITWQEGTPSTTLTGNFEWALNPGEGGGAYASASLNVTVNSSNDTESWSQIMVKNVTRPAGVAPPEWRLCYARTTLNITNYGQYNYLFGPIHWKWTNVLSEDNSDLYIDQDIIN